MSRAEELLDTTLDGKYRVEVVVTENAEYFVFAGRQTDSGTPVTIRIARPLRGMSAEELDGAFRTFAEEAAQLARLSKESPSIEPLVAFGELDATGSRERLAYCVFARTDGSSLAQMRGRGAQPIGRAIIALEPVAKALAAAHAAGCFHGDVRPDNLILVEAAKNPEIRLVRFALATRLGTGTKTFAPEYGAPEHFKRGDNHIGPSTDVYGLALCLVEIATGRPPLEGSHPSELYKQTTDITRRPTLVARGAIVSPAIEAVVARAVAVNPKLRWPNAAEFWAALVAAASSELREESDPGEIGTGVDPDSASVRALPTIPDPITPTARYGMEPAPPRVRVGLAIAVGLGFGLVFLITLFLATPARPRPSTSASSQPASSALTPSAQPEGGD